MKTITFITNNDGKFAEMALFLKGTSARLRQVKLDLEEIQDVDAKRVIRHKAQEAIKKGYSDFILEDTSLYIDGMERLPGPLIKWFLSELGNSGIVKLASCVGERKAKTETTIAYVKNRNNIKYFTGISRGMIVPPKGRRDFGWGPIFLPSGAKKTFGQMLPEEKHQWSMRIKALKKLKAFLILQ